MGKGRRGGLRFKRAQLLDAAETVGEIGVLKMLTSDTPEASCNGSHRAVSDADLVFGEDNWIPTLEEQEFLDILGPPSKKRSDRN